MTSNLAQTKPDDLQTPTVALCRADRMNIMGTSHLVRMAFQQHDLLPLWTRLVERITVEPLDAGALMDMAVILQLSGQREKGLEVQDAALQIQRCYRKINGQGDGLKVLIFMAAGDLMANTPIDFLLEGSDSELLFYYVDAGSTALPELPEHDVAFVAIGESEANVHVLENLENLLKDWPGRILNNAPNRIRALTRDGVAAAFCGEASILAPATTRVERNTLLQLALDNISISLLLPNEQYPIIVRPIGSHAGHGMEKIDSSKDLLDYFARHNEQQFYVCPFINYGSPDGLFRKQRIAFISGRPFASHFAASESWMVHYLSARMTENESRRLEEANWMDNFADFAKRHQSAFTALSKRIGLDYFVIDCAEMPDGRLILFEVDVAMIVHDMDSDITFPYKKHAMRKLFDAFSEMVVGEHKIASQYGRAENDKSPSFFFSKRQSAM